MTNINENEAQYLLLGRNDLQHVIPVNYPVNIAKNRRASVLHNN